MCFWLSDYLIIKKDTEGGFFSPWEGSGYKESSFGNFELETSLTPFLGYMGDDKEVQGLTTVLFKL